MTRSCSGWYLISQATSRTNFCCPGLLLILFTQTMSQTILGLHSGCPGLLPMLFNLAPDHIWSHRQCPRPSLDFTLDVLDYYRYCSILLQTIYGLTSNSPDQLWMSQTMMQSCSRPYVISQTMSQTILGLHSGCPGLLLILFNLAPDHIWPHQ